MTTEIIKYRIVRRTSPYNKYIKWFRECFKEEGILLSSTGYRTEKEARNFSKQHWMPIGNRILEIVYQEANPEPVDHDNPATVAGTACINILEDR